MGTDLSIYPLNPNYMYVWKAADMLTLVKQTKFQNHVVCEMPLTCWLCFNRLNFRTMRCVKGCWQADFAWTDQISEPCGVWKATDLLTLLKQTKFPNHVVCEMILTCWLRLKRENFPTMWCVPMGFFSIYPLNTNSIYVWKAADMLTLFQHTKFPNHVVCEMQLTCWLCLKRPNFLTMWCVKTRWLADFNEMG